MLKFKNFINTYSKLFHKIYVKTYVKSRLDFIGQSDKIHIYNMNDVQNQNTEIGETDLIKKFFLTDFYSIYYKMKNKLVINYHDDYCSNSDSLKNHKLSKKVFFHNFFEFLLKENYIYKKIEKLPLIPNESNKETEKTFYYLKINNSKYLEQIEKSNEECRLSKQSYKWSNGFLKEQEKLMKKNFRVKICFEFKDQSIKGKENFHDLFIEVSNPEYLYGATFIVLKSEDEFFKKFLFDKIYSANNNSKTSYILPSNFYAVNSLNNDKLQILILDKSHQLANEIDHNLRACVPGHNEIDYKLAKEFSLPIKFIVKPVNQISSQLETKMENSTGIEDIIKIKSTSFEEIKETLKSFSPNGPLIFKDTEGFLTGCKEFDYLYLNEARELIVKNLIGKRKAICEKNYKILDPLIAVENNINDSEASISYTEIFKMSANLFYLSMEETKDNMISIDRLKRLFPIDLLININSDEMSLLPSSQNSVEVLFYSRVLYLIILDLLNINKRHSIWEESIHEMGSEEVILPSDLTNSDLIFSEPFKEIIDIPNTNKYFKKIKECDVNDVLRFFYFYSISHTKITSKDTYLESKPIIEKFFNDLSNLHDKIIEQLNTQKFDLDKVRDEKLEINKLSNNNLITEINTKIIDVINNIDSKKTRLSESASEMITLLELVNTNYLILKENFNFLVFLYFNYLLLLNPFCPNLAGDRYQALKQKTGNSFNKENLCEYSLLKLQETSNFFIDMIKNTIIMNVIIDGKTQGNVILSKTNLENKQLILEVIKDTFKLDQEIIEKFSEVKIEDGHIKITTSL